MACKRAARCLCHIILLPHRFRWVYCQLEVLRHCFPSNVRQILAELPESLDETYERILQQIPKSNRPHTHRLLQCLTVAIRPLLLQELAEVLVVDFSERVGTPKLNEGFRWEDQGQAVLSACSSLITVVEDRDANTVHFSHFSVKEFLTSDRLAASTAVGLRYHHIRPGPAHTIMAQACLGVLLHLTNDMDLQTIQGYHLAKYAGEHFHDHANFEDVSPRIIDGIDDLLDPEKPHFDTWLWLQIGDGKKSRPNDSLPYRFFNPCNPERQYGSLPMYPLRAVPLYYVAALGHTYLAKRLILTRPQDLHAKDNQGRTPLHVAVLAGKVEASNLLIGHTADLNILDINDHNLLHTAAYNPHFEITRMLLEHDRAIKAHINARNKNGQTPLHLVLQRRPDDDCLSAVALLLKFGADVDARDHDSMTPLHYAIEHSTPSDVAMLMVEFGSSLRQRDGYLPFISRWHPSRLGVELSFCIHVRGPVVGIQEYDNMVQMVRTSEYLKSGSAARLLLDHGASIHTRSKDGRTPLHLASQYDLWDVVMLLVERGADVDSQDNNNMTPLLCAIESGRNLSAAQLLLDCRASIDLRDKNGQTPLHFALRSSLPDVVALLLKFGAEVDSRDNNNITPLLCTTITQDFKSDGASQLLLEHGASVNVRDKDGRTPLHLVGYHGSPDVAALLLKLGLEVDVPDNDGITPLLCALKCFRGGKPAQVLLEHGASVNVRDKDGKTPLHLASEMDFPDMVASLSKLGADMDALDNRGLTPLLHALKFTKSGGAGKALLEHGASVHVRDENGQTPLHLAFQRRSDWMVPFLIEAGADVNAQDNDGTTPLLYVVESYCRTWAQQILLEHGASVHLKNKDGRTALHFAVQRYCINVAASLLHFGAPVDALDNDNMTPLCTLAFSGSSIDASILLHHGASVHTRNKNGQTPLHFASRYNPSNVAVLLQSGADVNVQDNNGATPLHFALASSSQDIFIEGGREYAEGELLERNLKTIVLLLEHGANVNLRNVHDKTPLQVAPVRERQQVEQLLLHRNQS